MAASLSSADGVKNNHTRSPYRVLGLGFLRVLAVLPGVLITCAAFNEFARVYRYVPVFDVLILAAFGVLVSLLSCMGARANPLERVGRFLPLVAACGFGLGFIGMGEWWLSWEGLTLFPAASILSYGCVIFVANARPSDKAWKAAASAAAVLGAGVVPAVLVISGLHAPTADIRDVVRQIAIASVLGEVVSAALLGLTFAVEPPSRAPSVGSLTAPPRPT